MSEKKSPVTVDEGLSLLRMMLLIRRFEERAMELNLGGKIRGAVHPYIGEEAIATGICAALEQRDFIASYHRGHGHTLAKGGSAKAMMAELLGKATGMCRGKAGSLHVADISKGVLGANGIVGDGATLALGAAHSARLLATGALSVPFFGDGAISRGPVLEAMNWAKAFCLPMIFVCEDNVYSYTVRTSDVTGGPGPAARAAGFGLEARTIDGNDVIAIYEMAREMVARVRGGGGPAFIHALTYRHHGHIARDQAPYRPSGELARYLTLDPIPRCIAWLEERGASQDAITGVRQDVEDEIGEAVEAGLADPEPDKSELFTDTLDVGAPTW